MCEKDLKFAYPALIGRKKYCDKKCLKQHKAKPVIKCETCNIDFVRWQKTTRFCSPKCRGKGNQSGIRNCPSCGNNFSRGMANAKNKYCETCAPASADRRRLTLYGISKPTWDTMLALQNGKCFLCNKADATDMDHDHETGKPRLPLCGICNHRLGFTEANPEWHAKAMSYVNTFKLKSHG